MLRFLSELPVQIIAWLSDLLEKLLRGVGGVFRGSSLDDSEQPVGIRGFIRKGVGKLFWFFAQLVTYPFAGFLYRGLRFRAFILSIPFCVVLLGVVMIWLVVFFNRERILNRYLARVQNAYSKEDGRLGVRFALRWIDEPDYANAERKFLYSLVEIQAGNDLLAEKVLESLSPEDSNGLGIAHFWRANRYASRLENDSLDDATRSDYLSRFRWHLERVSGVSPNQIAVLNALEALWDGREDEAESIYRNVWQQDPYQSVGFAALLKKLGREDQRAEVLQLGAEQLTNRLRTDPWNRALRGQLALAYEAREDWDKAEGVYLEGFQITRDPETKSAYESFLDRRVAVALKDPVNYRELAYCMVRLVRTQGASEPVLELLSRSFLRPQEDLLQLQTELHQGLVKGLDLPIVHMCLAICKVLLNDVESGQWHIEQAYRYEPEAKKLTESLLESLIQDSVDRSEYQDRLRSWCERLMKDAPRL